MPIRQQKFIDCVIIPARGGSKRILHKNLTPFLGVPMLERSIQLAKKVSNYVIVSSDDNDVLQCASRLDVIPMQRDHILASDITPTLPVLHHLVMQLLKSNEKSTCTNQDNQYHKIYNIDKEHKKSKSLPSLNQDSIVLCLYATAMFANEYYIEEAYNALLNNPLASYAVSVIDNQKACRSFALSNNGYIEFLFPQFIEKRSQDLPQIYNDAGQFYLGFAKSYINNIALLGNNSIAIKMDIAYDIDTQQDLAIAELLKQQFGRRYEN